MENVKVYNTRHKADIESNFKRQKKEIEVKTVEESGTCPCSYNFYIQFNHVPSKTNCRC